MGSSRAFSSVGFRCLGFRFKVLELQGVRFSDSGLLGGLGAPDKLHIPPNNHHYPPHNPSWRPGEPSG